MKKQNPWVGQKIKDLDISRHSMIILVKRGEQSMIPNSELVLEEEDEVFLYTQKPLSYAKDIEI